MAVTVQDVVNAALTDLGVLAEDEVPSTAQSNYALTKLNGLVDQWAAERLSIYTLTNTVWNLTPSKVSYTIGANGDVNIARPIYIDHVNYINTSFTPIQEFPGLQPLTDDAWSKIPNKGLTGTLPSCWWWQSNYPLGVLYFWPIPTSATLQGSLYAPTAIPQFAALTTTVALPPGYWRMLTSNLARELAPGSGSQVLPETVLAAQESVAVVKRANKKLMDMSIDPAALGGSRNRSGHWSIFTGP